MEKRKINDAEKFNYVNYRKDGLYLNTNEYDMIELMIVSEQHGVIPISGDMVDIIKASIEEEKQKAIEGYMNTHTSTPKAEAAIVSTKSPQGLVSEEVLFNLISALKYKTMKKKTLNIQTPNKVIELLEKGSKKERKELSDFMKETLKNMK